MSKLLLAGSGEFTDSMNEIDKSIVSTVDNPRVMIIPAAAGKEKDSHKWIDDGINHFSKIGIESFGADMISRENFSDDKYITLIDDCNFIYFSGGDPEYLFSCLKDTLFLRKIIERVDNDRQFILAGSSAGAMMMGKFLPKNLLKSLFNSNSETDISISSSSGIVDFSIIPHFNKFSKIINLGYLNKLFFKSFPKDSLIIGIDEDTIILTEDKVNYNVMGVGSVYLMKNGETFSSYKNLEKFSIK